MIHKLHVWVWWRRVFLFNGRHEGWEPDAFPATIVAAAATATETTITTAMPANNMHNVTTSDVATVVNSNNVKYNRM